MPDDKLTHIDLFSGIPSADSPSPRGGPDSAPSPSVTTTRSARKSSNPDLERLLPTPRSNEGFQGMEAARAYASAGFKQPKVREGKERKGRTYDTTLTTALVAYSMKSSRQGSGLLHTPTTGDNHPTYEKRYPGGKVRPSPIPNLAAEIEEGIAYIDRRSSPTSSPSTEPDSEEQLCLPGASPASLSVTPGSDEARKMTVRSGLKCLESSMRPGPLGSLERMLAASSVWSSTRCLLTWNWKVTPQGRSILELSASTPRTAGCESGLLLTTPNVQDDRDVPNELRPSRIATGRKTDYLSRQIAMLPTPIAGDWKGQLRADGTASMLSGKIGLLPTPNLADYRAVGPKERAGRIVKGVKAQNMLRRVVTLLPTPNAFNAKAEDGWEMGSEWDRNKKEHALPKAVGTSRGLKLHSDFVAWMMNYPVDWLDISEQPKPTSKSGTKTGCKS
jgi:hypothetical protein